MDPDDTMESTVAHSTNNGATVPDPLTEPLDRAVRLTRALHDADWGDWSREALTGLAESRDEWTVRSVLGTQLVIRVDGHTLPLVADTRRYGLDADRYQLAEITLGDFKTGEAYRAVVDALSRIGRPTTFPGASGTKGLVWRDEERTVLLQSSDIPGVRGRRRVWLAVHPRTGTAEHVPTAELVALGDLAAEIHGADTAGESSTRLYTFPTGSTLARRRDLLSEVFDAVCGAMGTPTIYDAAGADVRWRTEARVLRLRSDRTQIWLETAPTDELENEEFRTFKWGGAWSGAEPSDFRHLPYLWQLERQGPGDSPRAWPGGRLAASVEHLSEALELVLASWIEQIPAQLGADWATFEIVNRADRGRSLRVSFSVDQGVTLGLRDQEASDETTAAMTDRGWTADRHGWWRATFPDPTAESAHNAARLVVAELTARGAAKLPDDLRQTGAYCNDMGDFQLFGVGLER